MENVNGYLKTHLHVSDVALLGHQLALQLVLLLDQLPHLPVERGHLLLCLGAYVLELLNSTRVTAVGRTLFIQLQL